MPTTPLQLTTPTDTTIVLTRDFRAPRRLVWEAMFTPERMRRWMLPPPAWTMTACECDPRPAGALRLAWSGEQEGAAMTLYGVFTEVVVHERATHTECFVLGGELAGVQVETHAFAERDGVTTLRITQVYASKQARDGAADPGMAEGMEAGFKRLEAMLAG
jgi:uncharacterized protein YndB with AHSA1/START domain